MTPDYAYITESEAFEKAIAALSGCDCIGVDIEGDSLFSYKEQVSLIQVSGGGKNYIFDPLLLDSVLPLAALFENRSILKIFHGSDYDIVSLKRDFNFKIGPVYDTALAARAIGVKQFSLQNLIETYFQVTLSKKFQKANWKLRPLSKEQLDYAALDTIYLYPLYQILNEAVAKKGRTDQIEEECRLMEDMTWTGRPFEPNDYIRTKGARTLSPKAQKILRELIAERDQIAKERDAPPFKIISSRDLILMSEKVPRSPDDMKAFFPKKNISILKYESRWLKAVQQGLVTEAPLPERTKSLSPPLTSGQEKLLKALKNWRNQQAEAEGLEPAMVMTGGVLKEIARLKPAKMDVFHSIPMMRQWQIRRYGEPLLKEIHSRKSVSKKENCSPIS